ncbi:tyrosine-type recombinase/integrase [Mycolicibacterium sp. CR10]|uniref:tyrosine-type recombinase/integrase n=1 Tax=Mycolicibacterium sp. CR10 TaxID=2562314 RepID=UPI0010C14AE9|nr:tyrosine-type recombinase/integrase [Mycolicibacterium sp. CR10]
MESSLPDLATLLDSWQIQLTGERKSPETKKAYRAGVQAFLAYCADQGITPELTKPNVVGWVATMAEQEPATVRLRLTAVKLFARWLAEEEQLDVDSVLTVRAPKLDQKIVEHLTDNAVQAMLTACNGTELRDYRDKAMIVLFTETGARAAEMLALTTGDVSPVDCVATIRRGKGAKGRRVKFSPQCAAVLDKYLRARRKAGHGDGPLWVSQRGPLSYTGMKGALAGRAERAGVTGFHPHRLRHTSAVRWLKAGGSESGLMAQAGWQSRKQIDRYIRSAAEELAADEFDRLDLGIEKS